MAEGEAGRVQVAFQIGPEDACLNSSRRRLMIDAHQPIHLPEIQRHRRFALRRLDTTDHACATTERNHGETFARRQTEHRHDLLFARRCRDDVRWVRYIAGAYSNKILVPFSQTAGGSGRHVRRHSTLTEDATEGGQHRVGKPRRPQTYPLERIDAPGGLGRAQARPHISPEAVRVRKVVGPAFLSPAPPLRASRHSAIHSTVL